MAVRDGDDPTRIHLQERAGGLDPGHDERSATDHPASGLLVALDRSMPRKDREELRRSVLEQGSGGNGSCSTPMTPAPC